MEAKVKVEWKDIPGSIDMIFEDIEEDLKLTTALQFLQDGHLSIKEYKVDGNLGNEPFLFSAEKQMDIDGTYFESNDYWVLLVTTRNEAFETYKKLTDANINFNIHRRIEPHQWPIEYPGARRD